MFLAVRRDHVPDASKVLNSVPRVLFLLALSIAPDASIAGWQEKPGTATEQAGSATILELLEQLRDSASPIVRARAASRLADLGAEAAPGVPALIRALRDESWDVRAASVRALLAIGPEAAKAIPDLEVAAADTKSGIAVSAREAVDKIREAGAAKEHLRLNPNDAEAWMRLAAALIDTGQADDSLAALQEAVRLRPGFAQAWVALGQSYEARGRFDQAANAFGEAQRVDPSSIEKVISDNTTNLDRLVPLFGVRGAAAFRDTASLALAYGVSGRNVLASEAIEDVRRSDPGKAEALEEALALRRAPPEKSAPSPSLAETLQWLKTPLFLSGTITNLTNAANPVTAPATISVDSSGNCVVRIEAPLFGSGPCSVTVYEPGGPFSLVSQGPLNRILWTGRHATANQIAGTYSLANLAEPSLPDHGSFALSIGEGAALSVPDVLRIARTTVDNKDYLVVQERNLISLHRPDGSYAGARLLLGPAGEPVLWVLDYSDGSRVLDPATKAIVMEWVASRDGGYHVGRNGKTKQYYDRFLNPLPWSSVSLDNGDEVFLKTVGDDVELFDKDLRSLNIRSGKTASGRQYWTKTVGDAAVFFDERFQPLNWYALQRNGQRIYASVDRRGKAHFFDDKMRELGRPNFWRKLAVGLAVGLSAYGQALQAQAAQAASPPPLILPAPPPLILPAPPPLALPAPPPLPSVGWQPTITTTTTTRIGGMTIANTYGAPGGSSSIYSQRVGSLDLLSGTSPSGGWLQGYVQHVGSIAFVNLRTPGDTWSGTSQSIGNFTFHRFDSARGALVTGSSQRVGDFIFTTLR